MVQQAHPADDLFFKGLMYQGVCFFQVLVQAQEGVFIDLVRIHTGDGGDLYHALQVFYEKFIVVLHDGYPLSLHRFLPAAHAGLVQGTKNPGGRKGVLLVF